MARFELTAELDLQAPNLGRTINDLRRQLNGIDIDVSIVNGRRSARQIGEINRRLDETNNLTSSLVKNLGISVRRFTAFAIATRTVSLFTNTLGKATEEAIEFEKELIKISQVSGKTLSELQGLENTITSLSTSLGTSSKNLLSATRILAQAGIEAGRLDVALDALAKTTLAPTFEDIEKTAEGAVAILSQFERGVGALSEQLGAINAVAGQFAVESGDLISAVRRTGGVFKSAGGDLNELLALFTSVRATTRESAESIATGLRTIFTRIQRPKTIEFLKQFGVELTDLNGKFIGPFEAVKQLSQALAGLEEGDIQFVRIAEELGGFRQIGKVIPLIQQFETAERARQAAIEGGTSLDRDAITAQQSLSNQLEKTREKFLALIRSIADTGTFQTSIRTVLKLADSFIDLADAIKPILPLIGAIGAFSAVRGLAGFGRNFTAGFTGQRRNQGGPIQAFATGGMVPGTGNRDTVPAMLTPGEFVIRKSSVESIGAENLARMNRGGVARYRKGTKKKGAQKKDIQQGETVKIKGDSPSNPIIGQIAPGGTPGVSTDGKYETTLSKLGIRLRKGEKPNTKVVVRANVDKNVLAPKDVGFEETVSKSLNKVQPVLDSAASKAFDLKTKSKVADDKKAVDSISGFLFESFASAVAGKASGDKNPFDFIGEKKSKQISKFADADPIAELLDAKNTFVNPGQIIKKAVDYKNGIGKFDNRLKFDRSKNFFGGLIQKFAAGGIVDQKAAGAAILDPEPASSKSVSIGVEDVKKKFSEFSKLAKGKDPVSKFYKSTSFDVTKSGLNKETSDKFKVALEDGLISGVNTSASILANDLGTPNAKIDQSQATNFVKGINTQVFGRLFETTVDSIKRQGNYDKPDNNPNRPFDAEQGLPSVLKDNFKGLPDKFIDLKTSAAAASDANLKGKILDQIKIELIRDGILNADYPGKAGKDKDRTAREVKDEKQRQADKAVGRGFPARRNAGGPAPSDTVPALLTPGEFVFSKEASQRIGYGNLDRMNKKGVQGFAAGGAVQVARYNAGTGPSGVDLSDINNFGGDSPRSFPIPTGGLERLDAAANDAADANENGRQATEERSKADVFAALSVATSFIPRSEDASSAMGRFQNSILDSITTVSASIAALEAFNIKLLASGDQGSLLTGLGRRGQVGTQKFGRKVAGAIPGVSARGAVRFGKALSKVTTVASRALGPFVAVAAATKLVSNSFDALAGRAKAVEDAIQAGSPDDAAKAAASQQTAKDAGTVAAGFAGAGAAIGSLIAPGIGTAIGAVIGGVGGLIAKETGALDSFGDDLRDNVIAPFTGNTRELISIQSREAANRVKIEKELQKATKKSAQTLEAFAEGGATLEEAISALSGGLKEELALLQSKETLNKAEIKAQEGRGVLGFFGEDVEKTSQLKESNKKIEEQRTKIVTDAFKKGVSSDIIRKAINERIARGEPVDVDDLINQLIPEGARESLDEKDIENARTKLNNMANAAQRNADFIKSLNFGLRDVSSSIGATSLAVKNSLATFEPGFNSLALSASTLEAAITSAGAGIDQSSIDKSLSDLEAQFIKFGGDPKQVNQLSETIKALNDLQRAGPELLSGIKDELTANLNTNPQQIRDALSNQLLQSVPEGSDLRRRLEDNIRGLEIDDEVRSLITSGNLEGLLEKILGPLGESAKKQLANFTEIGKLQEQLNPLIKKRIDLENKLVSAQKQSLDIQLEAAKAIESFGGATVTSGDKLSILDKKLELDLGNAGFGGAIGSSPKDLIRVNQELKNAYEKAVNSSREGQGGLESQAQAKNIESAQESLLDNLRGRIKLAQQEIDIAKKKNELEKSALQKLIEGDAIGFFEEQQVASASRALSRGDERSIRQFTQDVIGKAFAKLQSDDTLSDRDRRRAARSALPFGFQSQRNIGILSETTPELRRLKDAGIEAAEALSLIGESLSDFREADIGVVKGDIKKVEGIIQDPTRQQTTTTGNTPPAQLAKGGVVYANEGAFIPKGTDTVPAMLTPGEYVVNSKAVQSGNNLSLLQSMNSGKTVYANMGGFIPDVVSLAGLKPADVLGVAGAYYSLGLYQPSSDRTPTAQQKANQKQAEEEIQKEIAQQEKIAADKKRKAAEREAARKKIVELYNIYNRIRGVVNYAAERVSDNLEYYREQAAIRREQADIREADQKKLDRYKLDVQTYNEQKKAYEKDQAKRRKFGLGQDDNGKEIFEIKRPNIAAYRDPRDKKPYKITLDSISIFSDSPDSALIPYGAKVEDNRSKEEKLAIKNNLELGNAYKKGTFDEEEFNQRKSKGGFKSISSYEEYLKLREIPFRENRSRYLQRQQAKINETKDSFYDESARRYDSAERKLKISRAKDEQRLQVAIAAGNTKQVERLERKIAKDQEKFNSRYGRANNKSEYMTLVQDNVNNERERRLVNPTVGLDQRVGVRDFSGYNDALVEDRIYTQQLVNKPDQVREPQLALKSGTTKGGYFNEQEQSIRNMEDRGDIPREYGPVEDTEQRKRSGAGSGIGIFFSKGGPVYASRGQLIPKSIFQPRGTDTVPAMLTPGEFVVNRQAVRAGNNLAVLQEMNSRPAAPVTPTATMSRGGQVGNTQYLQNGGEVSGGAQDNSYLKSLESQLATLAQKLESGFSTFGQHVESFQSATNTEMMVNVNQTGSMRVEAGSTLSNSLMKNSKDIAMSSVNGQIDRASIGLDGKMRTTNSVLG